MIKRSSGDFWIKVIVLILIFVIGLSVSYLAVSCRQKQMDGGIVVDKYIIEKHTKNYSYYDSSSKTIRIQTVFIPTSYTLVVEKELNNKIRIKEVSVSAEKYYFTNIGEIYYK